MTPNPDPFRPAPPRLPFLRPTAPTNASVFTFHGTARQQDLARAAVAMSDFPFPRLLPGLTAKTRRTSIPVDWQDLSRYAAVAAAAEAEGSGHVHVHDGDDVGHPVVRYGDDGRARVLGLAWYSGRVTLDLSCETNPALAAEVLLAEGAHMVDFFYMTDEQRRAVINALHREQLPPGAPVGDGIPHTLDGHTCGWFDVGPYRMWTGEAMMEAFIEAFSPVRVTIQLGHPVSPPQATYIRRALLGPELVGTGKGHTYHRPTCPFIRPHWMPLAERDWPTPLEAQRDGRRPCRVCRPT